MSIEAAQAIVTRKGNALSAADVHDIENQLLLAPADEAHEAGPWLWESVALIVNDPNYRGDAKLPPSR